MKNKLKICLVAGFFAALVQGGLFADDSSRYNYDVSDKSDRDRVTMTLVNNTDYSIWLTVKNVAELHRSGMLAERISNNPGEEEDRYPFGRVWIGPGERITVENNKEAPEGRATLFYEKNPSGFSYGKVVDLYFDGMKSTASESSDVKVTIEAEPVLIFYEEIFYSAAYLYEWYNYTITVDPK